MRNVSKSPNQKKTYEESAKDDEEEWGNAEKDLGDVNGLVDQGQHAVIENYGDPVVEEGLAKYKEVEAGVHLVIMILNLKKKSVKKEEEENNKNKN